jgi:uncharacterized Fe-S cluster-containing radical SAM superfamily protein
MITTVDIELVGSCNYACKMCPQGEPGRDKQFLKSMPQNLFEDIIDQCVPMGLKMVRLHGSGEPTLSKYLAEAVAYCKNLNLKTEITTNGERLNANLAYDLVQAGLDYLTVSVIGATESDYKKWMNSESYHLVKQNIKYFNSISTQPSNLYHLITTNSGVQDYLDNWHMLVGGTYEIWQMHNWSGAYNNLIYPRQGEKRSCGRMFQPVLTVRAGGLEDHKAAVVPCCMTLGNDVDAVLGHLDNQTVKEIWNGELYKNLRQAHSAKQWDNISYCQNCDQLYQYKDSLVATNRQDIKYGDIKYITLE